METEELTSYTPQDAEDIEALMRSLSPNSIFTAEKLDNIINDTNSHLYIIRINNHIKASACLCVAHTTEYRLGFVQSVIVSAECRGRHLGRQIMEHIIKEAKRLKIDHLQLTSNPKREAANKLYQSVGFVLHQTNCYNYKL